MSQAAPAILTTPGVPPLVTAHCATSRHAGASVIHGAAVKIQSVTGIDWLILAFTLALALYGYGQGLMAGAMSLGGFALGAFLGTRLAPALLPEGAASPYAPMFGLLGGLLGGAILALSLEGVAQSVRERMRSRLATALDGLGGALLTAAIALGLSWITGAVVLQTPAVRELRDDVQRSLVLRRLNATLPPSGPILNALARIDPFPRLEGPSPRVGPPPAAVAGDPDIRRARPAVVRILGSACGLGVQGSGWVAGDGLVVTNAHVVAGTDDSTVQLDGDGDILDARAVFFDVRNDLAVLAVEGLTRPGLPLAGDASAGTPGAVLGYPGNGPYDVRPARVGATVRTSSSDAYGRGPVSRRLTVFRGRVRQGNSGGPLVDRRGRVLATVFAATVGGPAGGYGVPNGLVRSALRRSGEPVGTGPCTS